MVKRFLSFLLILFSISGSLYAYSPPILLENKKEFYELGPHLDFLEDPTGKLTIKEVNSSKWSSSFQKSTQKVLSFGFTNSTIWVRLPIKNNSSFKKWILRINFPDLDHITFFKKGKNQRWVKTFAGDRVSSKQWEMRYKDYIFHLEEGVYFLKVTTRGGITLPIHLMTERFFKKSKERNDLFLGGFMAVLITMFFYNLMIGLALRSKTFFIYVGYIFFWGILSLVITGLGRYQFIDSSYFSNEMLVLAAYGMLFTLLLFSKNFLDIDENRPVMNKFFTVILIFLAVFFVICNFLPQRLNLVFLVLFGCITCGQVLFAGLYLFKVQRTARFFSYSFSLLSIGGILKGLSASGIVPSTLLTEQGIFLGSIVQLIMLSLGLADTFNFMKEKSLKKERELKKIQENYSKNLEEDVNIKTNNINALIENLEQGFMVIDKGGVIQSGATQASINLFGVDPSNKKLEKVLKLGPIEKQNFQKWLSHIFKGLVPFKDLTPLAPQTFEKIEGKVVTLDYKPIFHKGQEKKLNKIICIATDITEKINLEKEAKIERENAKRLGHILEHPLEFLDLMTDAEEVIEHYIKNFKASKPNTIFRSFHTLKARFSGFYLSRTVKNIHNLESFFNEIEDDWSDDNIGHVWNLIEKIRFDHSEFVKANRKLLELANNTTSNFKYDANPKELMKKIENDYFEYHKKFVLTELSGLFQQYISPTKELADQQDKLINFKVENSDILVNPKKYKDCFETFFHIFRNAIDHGVESREERIAKNKSEVAELIMSFESMPQKNNFKIKIKDDGKGLDPDNIRKIALKNKNLHHLKLDKLSNRGIIQVIFEQGFSSKEEITEVSGRGVGMDAVKTAVEDLGGSIKVMSKVDFGTTFEIILPLFN